MNTQEAEFIINEEVIKILIKTMRLDEMQEAVHVARMVKSVIPKEEDDEFKNMTLFTAIYQAGLIQGHYETVKQGLSEKGSVKNDA